MAKTYAWVLEQEIADMARRNEETVRWILKQQERDMRERLMFAMCNMESRYWDLLETFDEDAEYHRKPRSGSHGFHGAPQAEMCAAIEEEIRRLQARRHEAEKCREAYGRRKILEEQRERERRKQRQEKGRAEREAAEKAAWKEYELRWESINSSESSDGELTFETIPWPQVARPRTVEDIRGTRIAMFLLSSQHSEGLSKKDRIRAALRRWHPDRFGRLLSRVRQEDRAKVEEGAGVVARCLNNMLERAA
ncbi:hypothetical protein EIP86_009130 [Pleurotus ostreatoroseus]|nr:hypothetical protein EIP86_009130 [Pleurotus ostreatoroseus]